MRRLTGTDAILAATVLIWAFNYTSSRYALTHGWAPLAFLVMRFSIGGTLTGASALVRERSLRVARGDLPLLALAACLGIYANQVAYAYAIKHTTATTVALVLGCQPIFAGLFARMFGIERVGRRFWAAAVVSFGGVALVGLGSTGGVSGDVAGVTLAVVAGAAWAGYSLVLTPLTKRYSQFRISAVVIAIGLVPILATGLPRTLEQDLGGLSTLSWLCVAYAAVGSLAITNVLWYTAVKRVGASRATLYANAQPFLAVLFAFAVLSEDVTWLQVAGGAAIAGGIVLARRPDRRGRSPGGRLRGG